MNDRNLVVATCILAAIGALQLFVFGYQAIQLKKTVKAAGEQGEDMKKAIRETSRSATATEQVAKHIESSLETATQQSNSMTQSVAEAARLASAMEIVATQIAISSKAATESVIALRERTAQQMRAYLTVNIGMAIAQNRTNNIKFQVKPLLINTGHTPAHNVAYKARVEIRELPLPSDFSYPLPGAFVGSSVLGPQQNASLNALMDDFCDDTEVESIKRGLSKKGVCVWGIVTYEDVFGEKHTTKFCQVITWPTDETVWGYYLPKHNDAT